MASASICLSRGISGVGRRILNSTCLSHLARIELPQQILYNPKVLIVRGRDGPPAPLALVSSSILAPTGAGPSAARKCALVRCHQTGQASTSRLNSARRHLTGHTTLRLSSRSERRALNGCLELDHPPRRSGRPAALA